MDYFSVIVSNKHQTVICYNLCECIKEAFMFATMLDNMGWDDDIYHSTTIYRIDEKGNTNEMWRNGKFYNYGERFLQLNHYAVEFDKNLNLSRIVDKGE